MCSIQFASFWQIPPVSVKGINATTADCLSWADVEAGTLCDGVAWSHCGVCLVDVRHTHQVISISYGDDEPGVNEPYAQRVNIEFQKLGARGVSIMVSRCATSS